MAQVTKERLAELTDRLETGIKELYDSNRYTEYLAAMSKFHHYSFGNALLILLQCPTASRVAGYGTWKKLGRQVKRHEKGIHILAPCPSRRPVDYEQKDPKTGKTLYGPDGKPLIETVFEPITRFKVATVFDISQTEGRELPNIGTSELTGEVEHFTDIFDRLTAISPLPIEMEDFPGAAKGYASFQEQRIVIRPGMSQMQTIKTLVHEIAHAKLHDPAQLSPEERKQRREKEVEAESVAYVVCQHFGLDTSEYSFGYIAGWSRGRELAELKASLDCIHSTASELINAIQPSEPLRELAEQMQDQEQHQEQRQTKRKEKRSRK